jgi:hypothetical protein
MPRPKVTYKNSSGWSKNKDNPGSLEENGNLNRPVNKFGHEPHQSVEGHIVQPGEYMSDRMCKARVLELPGVVTDDYRAEVRIAAFYRDKKAGDEIRISSVDAEFLLQNKLIEIIDEDWNFRKSFWEKLNSVCGQSLSYKEKSKIARALEKSALLYDFTKHKASSIDIRKSLEKMNEIRREEELRSAVANVDTDTETMLLEAEWLLKNLGKPHSLADQVRYAHENYKNQYGGRPPNFVLKDIALFAVRFFQDKGLSTGVYSRGDDLSVSSNLVKFTAQLVEQVLNVEYKSHTAVAREITVAKKTLLPKSRNQS